MLRSEQLQRLKEYIANKDAHKFMARSVHFTENQDEYPAQEAFSTPERALAAAVISYAIPGYPLVTLRQLLGMGTPEGAIMEMKSPDAGIYRYKYPDILTQKTQAIPQLVDRHPL